LYSAFRSAQWIKKHHPEIKIAAEVVSKYGTTLTFGCSGFEFFDLLLDDGEVPLEELITNIEDPNYNSYKRTFLF
jgi:hypothetical protein